MRSRSLKNIVACFYYILLRKAHRSNMHKNLWHFRHQTELNSFLEIQQPENHGDENGLQLMGNPTNFSGIKAIWNNTVQPALYWNGQTILLAILTAVCGAGLLYLDFEMTDKCLSLLQFNVTVSPAVQR